MLFANACDQRAAVPVESSEKAKRAGIQRTVVELRNMYESLLLLCSTHELCAGQVNLQARQAASDDDAAIAPAEDAG